ncbi:MAG: gliding motility-associated C-terminal domain-containing protein, partial [Bacteroidetes bacterium]|nr:gliding motility-associated C-terminal domain-containing protein [Bacteroidota bacterium]
GSQIAGHFTSDPIASGSDFNIEVDNGAGCGTVEVVGTRTCGCGTYSGTMILSPITVCEGNTVTAPFNNNEYLNFDDLHEFIIHDHSGQFPFDALATNSSPVFTSSDIPGFVAGQTYYISSVAGYDDGNSHVDPSDPCYSQSMGTPVVWMANPSAVIDDEYDEICGKTIQMDADTPLVGYGFWECSTCDDFITVNNTSYTDYNAWITVADDYGSETFTWTVYNGSCSASDSIMINFLQTPTAYAGPDINICDITAPTAAVINISGGWGEWSGPGNFDDDNNPVTLVTMDDAYYDALTQNGTMTLTYTWTEYNGAGPEPCSDDDYVKVTFIKQPEPQLGDDDTVCGVHYTLNAQNPLDSAFRFCQWSAQSGATVNIADNDNPQTLVTFTGPLSSSATVEFYYYEKNTLSVSPVCEARDTIKITFLALPNANAGIDGEVCGNSFHLDADLSGTFGGTWSVSNVTAEFDTTDCPMVFLGIGSPEGTHDPEAWITLTSLGAFGDTAWVEVPVYWIVSNNICKSMDSTIITFYQKPEANAGIDDSVCGKTYTFHADRSLEGSTSSLWTVLQGSQNPNGVTYIPNPPIDTNTTVNIVDVGVYYFQWEERNPNMPGICKDRDTVTITFFAYPQPDAGNPFYVCGKTTDLNAIQSPGTTGNWITISGVAYCDQSDPHSCVTVNNYDTLNFIWCEANSFCDWCDTVPVAFFLDIEAEQLTFNPGDWPDDIIRNCENIFTELDANSYTSYPTATGYWIDTVPGLQTFYHPGNPRDTVSVAQYGLHTFYWVLENGIDFDGTPVCRDSSDAVRIHFYQRPMADAGEDDVACGYEYRLNAQSTGQFQGVWSSSYDDAFFHYNSNPNDTIPIDSIRVHVLSYDQNPNYYEFYWQEDSGWDVPNFECSDIDTVKIIFSARPTGNFFYKIPACWGSEATVWADLSDVAINVSTSVFNWDFGENVDTVVYADSNVTGNGPHLVTWDMRNNPENTAHIVWLQSENEFGCKSFKHYDTIDEPARMDPEITVTPATCSQPNGEIELSSDTNTYSFTWLDGRIAEPGDTTVNGLVGGDSLGYYLLAFEAKAQDQATYPGVYCYDTFAIYVADTGHVTAMFDTTQFVITDSVAFFDSIIPAEITFTDLSTGEVDSWWWRFYDEDGNLASFLENNESVTESRERNPILTFTEPGIYTVQLIIESEFGCDDIYVWGTFWVVAESSIEIPNVFTPNGDGKNDIFRPGCVTMQSVHGIIFNRWGKKVHEWTWNHGMDEDLNGWDGKVGKGNTEAAPGVYMFIIEGTGMDGVVYEPVKGTVTLVRTR